MEAADVAHEHHENGEHKNVAEKLPLKATLDYYFRPKDQVYCRELSSGIVTKTTFVELIG